MIPKNLLMEVSLVIPSVGLQTFIHMLILPVGSNLRFTSASGDSYLIVEILKYSSDYQKGTGNNQTPKFLTVYGKITGGDHPAIDPFDHQNRGHASQIWQQLFKE